MSRAAGPSTTFFAIVADLTVLATERVTRKSLTEEDQRQLIEDALADLDLSVLGGGAPRRAMISIGPG